MNIQRVIEHLNKTHGYQLTGDYYKYIEEWRAWWKGYFKPFHHFQERGYNGRLIERKLYTLKMAKKVCEDWASILLNEKTEIVIEDKPASLFVLGKEADSDGVFKANDFWLKANELVEKAFYSGTGAFVLRLDDMKLQGDVVLKDPGTQIRIEYLAAMNIIPLTVKRGKVIDVAFVSEVLQDGKKFVYIETHTLANGSYTIQNRYFIEEEGGLEEVALPEGILPEFNTGSDIPMFAILKPNIINNIDEGTGLGISVFACAIDTLEGVDLAYNNFCRDFKLGGKKVFLNEQLTQTDENGVTLTPDDVAQQLFVGMGDGFIDKDGNNKMIQEFNPTLRVQENKDGVQAQLDYLSFKCGLGTKHYQFNAGSIVTATQYSGDKQELVQNASKHYIAIEDALKSLVKSILWVGKEVLGQNVNVDSLVSVKFDDGYIIDIQSQKQWDMQEIRDGLMLPEEYRVKWWGESLEEARAMLSRRQSNDDLMGFK